MALINKKRICNKHGFYNAIDNPNGCPLCKKQSDTHYSTNIRAKDKAKIYNSSRWKQVRRQALLRDNLMCIECKKIGVDTIATEVHHIIELNDDISKAFDLDNLESICHKHHMEHHHGR